MRLFTKILVISLLIVLFNPTTYAYAPKTEGSKRDYQLYLLDVANKYSVSYHELFVTIKCESEWNDKAVGDNGIAYSLAQYHKEAFLRHQEMAGIKGYDYQNGYHQLDLMGRSVSLGMWSEWSCFPK